MKTSINELIKKLQERGFFGIFFGSTLVKVMTFASALFLPKVISSKYEYGLLTDVDNLISYFLIVNGLGISQAVIRFCVAAENANEDENYARFRFIIKFGLLFDIILTILYLIYVSLTGLSDEKERIYLYLMSTRIMLVFLLETLQLFLRSQYKNREYTRSTMLYASVLLIFQLVFGYIWDTYGVIFARYLALILVIVVCIFVCKQEGMRTCIERKKKLTFSEQRRMIQYGFVCMISSASSLVVQSNQKKIIVDTINSVEELANYQVTTYMMQIMMFAINSIIIFVTPYFVGHKDNKEWCYRAYRKMMVYNALIMVPVHIMMFLFSRPFLEIVFGSQYLGADSLARYMVIASFGQSVFRVLPGNILPLIGYETYNVLVNCFMVVIHYILAGYLIRKIGINGAAIALAVVYIVSGILYMMKLHHELAK